MVAENDPFEDPPVTEAERMVADGTMTRRDVRLLLEIVRRVMWEEGEI
ncbi:MAG: hypothetical protein ABFC89_11545 [Methanospirillum sp.]